MMSVGTEEHSGISPSNTSARSSNPMRPRSFRGVIGQDPAKRLLQAAVAQGAPMPHALFVGPSGFGKTTLAHVVAEELGTSVYDIEAPVSLSTLLELRETMRDGDILNVEEIHQQAIMQRRGRDAATEPETFYALMEDRVIPTQEGPLPFPKITVIGTTTDEGMLPDAFVNRFPLRPRIVRYTEDQMILMAARNAHVLGLSIKRNAARLLATASRGTPREMNNLVINVGLFMYGRTVITTSNVETVLELNGITPDGLNQDMQAMLTFLYTRAKRVNKTDKSVVYQASVNTIATAIGKSRDSKAIALRVEPWLIEKGYVQVGHSGRLLTDAGVVRAAELISELEAEDA